VVPLLPRKILCVGRNYAEHAAEMKNEVPSKPLIFSKYSTSVIGSGELIRWSTDVTQQVDWEGELAVVIGKTARNIREEDAYDHIFGYTIANDVSARDLQSSESQWSRAKGHDTFCPIGPCIVTLDELPDPHNLRITTEVNGETMQDGHTGDMIFKIPYLVAYLSRTFTLEPIGSGQTRFTMTEVFTGPMMVLIGNSIPDLTATFEAFAAALKERAEAMPVS